MKNLNPYKLYPGEPKNKILLKALFPLAPIFHTHQAHKEQELSLFKIIKDYTAVGFLEVLKWGGYALFIQASYGTLVKYIL